MSVLADVAEIVAVLLVAGLAVALAPWMARRLGVDRAMAALASLSRGDESAYAGRLCALADRAASQGLSAAASMLVPRDGPVLRRGLALALQNAPAETLTAELDRLCVRQALAKGVRGWGVLVWPVTLLLGGCGASLGVLVARLTGEGLWEPAGATAWVVWMGGMLALGFAGSAAEAAGRRQHRQALRALMARDAVALMLRRTSSDRVRAALQHRLSQCAAAGGVRRAA